jgi:hypothetical protein
VRIFRAFVLIVAGLIGAVPAVAGEVAGYEWERLTAAAPYPVSYNYPVHVAGDGQFVALHPKGTWTSRDGKTWARAPLRPSGINSAYLSYLEHGGASWSLGLLKGNYQSFRIDPVIQRTDDYRSWRVVGQSPSLPHLVFYAAASFRGAMWIIGGFDGTNASAEVWRSTDGLVWTRVVERAPWSPRSGARALVFRERLYLIGGGVVDGPIANDVWSSADGINWRLETRAIAPEEPVGYTPIVFDGRLWLVGANRSGRFRSEMLVSVDGRSWAAVAAPWSPRGGVAAWTDGRSLFITGGKYSTEKNGQTTFVYSNDVWRMRRK